jgi:uncharacterized protein (UPF0128 family)
MSRQLLEGNYLDFHIREMENDMKIMTKNADTILKILDKYEKLVDMKSNA